MASCCTREDETAALAVCPECGKVGRRLDRVTLKALLRPEALIRLEAAEHRFCPTPDCPIVYFGREEVFERDEILVPVFQKESPGDRTVCYCFAETECDIRRELEETGRSTATERITALVTAGRCACEVRNPQGSCCLGNIASATTDAMAVIEALSHG